MRSVFGVFLALACLMFFLSCPACATSGEEIKVLILPKFEVDEMSGDFPGEAQHY